MIGAAMAMLFAAQTTVANIETPASFSLSMQEDTGGSSRNNWTVNGPVSMMSADVESVGTLELNITMDFGTSSDGSDDDFGTSFELQWGVAENHQINVGLPFNYGDGEDGNGDIYLGWQWKLWDEGAHGCPLMPSFAIYNEIRLPWGHQSSGVDWELRGIFTKSIIDNTWRVHANPFLRVLGGDNIETNNLNGKTQRNFAAGVILGTDYQLTDSTVLNFDYILDSGELNGYSMQHSMEAGLTYSLADNRKLAWVNRWTMDGDSQGDNWGMGLQYIVALN